MNPHFRKGNKAKHGSGHLWVLADIDEEDDLTITKVINKTELVQTLKPRSNEYISKLLSPYTGYLSTECGFCRPWCPDGMHIAYHIVTYLFRI